MSDMKSYTALWEEPAHTSFKTYDIYSAGIPESGIGAPGGVGIIEAFNLIECSDIDNTEHYTKSAEKTYQFIKILRVGPLFRNFLKTFSLAEKYFPENDLSQQSRMLKNTSKFIWSQILNKEWSRLENAGANSFRGEKSNHSAAEIAVDSLGNVAVLLHTINTVGWGKNGIFIDGISIPDTAANAKHNLVVLEPGDYYYDDLCPNMVLKNGQPVLASGSIGDGLHADSVQNIYNVLAYDHTPISSLQMPRILSADWWNRNSAQKAHFMLKGDFSDEMLDAIRNMGQSISVIDQINQVWAGIKIELIGKDKFKLSAGTTYGHVEGY